MSATYKDRAKHGAAQKLQRLAKKRQQPNRAERKRALRTEIERQAIEA